MKVINIEIKSEFFFDNLNIITKLIVFIKDQKIQKKCIVSSFNPLILYKLKQKQPQIILGYLYSNYHSIIYNLIGVLLCRPDNLHINQNVMRKPILWWAKRKELKINIYTINDKRSYRRALSLNVDGIFTDNIEYLK